VSDFPLMRRIVMDDPAGPLGATCDPDHTRSPAHALGGILGREPAARYELRRRYLASARERRSWESKVACLVAACDRFATGVRPAFVASDIAR
jgi:hypothetical protein